MVKKHKIKSVLPLVFLAVIVGAALIFTGCTKPENVSMLVAEGRTTIRVRVVTADLSSVMVEGASPSEIKGDDTEQTLTLTSHDRRIKIIKKSGNITELDCSENQLTALNVQGLSGLKELYCRENQLTALNVQGLSALEKLSCGENQLSTLNIQSCPSLKKLYCWNNQLNAEAFKKIFNALPNKYPNDNGICVLYSEEDEEKNHTDFTSPPDLKKAFEHALNSKGWTMCMTDIYNDYYIIK